ncbi:MAG: AMP-binding protein [Muribaculaceae bacterium]|nr:AMP-binding protein [Muribaculaceae bacterium]
MDSRQKIDAFLNEWHSDTDFIFAHSSGSTGKPKEIRLPKDDMKASARATVEFFGLNKQSRIAASLSADYIAGKMMIVRALEAGCEHVAIDVSRELRLADVLPLDLLAIVPAQIPSLVSQHSIFSGLKNILVGGSSMTRAQRRMLLDSGLRAWESYGMTETCSHVALRPVCDDESQPFEAMPGIRFETDERGCLCILSDRFSWQRLVTNDCVELLDDRHFLFKGRADNAIVSGGLKLHPEELEKEYAPALPGREYYVCGHPDETWGSAVVLVVEGDGIPDLEEKIASVVTDRRRLPKTIIYKDELPRTDNGKIIRTC